MLLIVSIEPITTADNILKYLYFYYSEKIRLYTSCELSAMGSTSNIKTYFLWKKKNK